MTIFGWILRVLFVLLLLRLILRLIFGAGRASRGPSASRPSRQPERLGGTLVRDPQCGTYVPISRALRVGLGDTAQYFCSTTCRDEYVKKTPVAKAGA